MNLYGYERIEGPQAEWKPKTGGFFERVRTEGERTLKEETHPVYKVTRLSDSFPNSLRVVGIRLELLDPSYCRAATFKNCHLILFFSQ